jgi:hypothetical protein
LPLKNIFYALGKTTAQPNNKDGQKDYTHYPPQQSSKSYNFNKSLYFSP